MKKQIGVAEAAKRLGISRMQVVRKIRRGEIHAVKIGRSYAIPEDGLPGIFRKMTSAEREKIDEAIRLVLKKYGDVIRRLGKE